MPKFIHSQWVLVVLFALTLWLLQSYSSFLITQSISPLKRKQYVFEVVDVQDWKHSDKNGVMWIFNNATERTRYLGSWESAFGWIRMEIPFFQRNEFSWYLNCLLHFAEYLLYHEIGVTCVKATNWSIFPFISQAFYFHRSFLPLKILLMPHRFECIFSLNFE